MFMVFASKDPPGPGSPSFGVYLGFTVLGFRVLSGVGFRVFGFRV